MQLRTFYGMVIVLPLIGLGLVAALYHPESGPTVGLAPGGTSRWLYPTSTVRGLLAYGALALWLLWALYRRPLKVFEGLLWLAPLAYVAAHVIVLAPLVLVQGQARAFLAEEGGLVALRLLVRLLVALGYLALVLFVRKQRWPEPGTTLPSSRS